MNMKIYEVSVVDFSDTPIDTTEYPIGYEDVTITTLDNPFSPFNDFDRWSRYDESQGYNTNQLLARLIGVASEFEDTGLGQEVENKFYYSTLVDIVRLNCTAPYVLVTEGDYVNGVYKSYDPNAYQGFKNTAPQTA